MRISALHLLAYGHFTDRSLTFGTEPGLHIIYGDNEAGKSTTLRALSSVLFGYPQQVVDGFQHDAKDIALGAELVAKDGQSLSFQRKRRGKNPLTNADGTPLDEITLARMLGGTSRDVFEKVFALDHHRLHDDARALLSEGGSLGFTLAAAGSGLSGLKATPDRLKAERAGLFLPTGSKPKLNQRIAQLVELRKEARRRAVSPDIYKRRQKEIDEVELALAEARGKDRAIDLEQRKLERIARNLPLRAQHNAVLGKLEALSSVPLLPLDASQNRIKAETDRDAAETDLTLAVDALAALDKDIAEIDLDQSVLDKSTEIDALSAQRAVIEDADKSIPKREAERTQHYATVRDLLAKAELPGLPTELVTLLPSLVKRRQVSGLADRGRALAAQDETLMEAAAIAEEDVRLANDRLEIAEMPTDMAPLNAALLAADTLGDIRADITKRTRVLSTRSKATREGIIGLGIASGDASSLRQLSVPSDETVVRFRQLFLAADAERTAHTAELARLTGEQRGIASRIETLTLGGATATKEELNKSRDARDEAWAIVRSVYVDKKASLDDRASALAGDGDVAGAFERRQEHADTTADAIIAHSKEAAELSLAARQKAEIENKITAANAAGDTIASRRHELEAEWTDLWPSAVIHIQSPAEMVDWLKRREALLREDIEQQTETDSIAELDGKETKARLALLEALKSLTVVDDNDALDRLRSQARILVTLAAGAATEHAKAIEALESEKRRKRQADMACERSKTQIAEWSAHWKSALSDAGLKDTLSVDAAVTILEIMTELDGLKLQIGDLSHRIETMTENKTAFEAAIAALGSLAAGRDGDGAAAISQQLAARLDRAKTSQNTLRNLREQQKIRTEAQRQASDRLERSKAALAALCAVAGCDNAAGLVEIEQASASKQDAVREREQLEKRMLEDGAGLALDILLSECEGIAGDALPGSIAMLTTERGAVEATIEKLMTERASLCAAFDALFGQSQAAEALQDAANVEADIAILTQTYADLTLQEIALRQAIDLYRDRNQGPILSRAKILFSQLTDGIYSGLRADIDDHDEAILIAEHTTRGSLEIGALSDGTVDPLYLALRLAVVVEHNDRNEPLPFIADDLLLSLDSTRAQATLRTLVTVAQTSQVLFFTHHDHMIALARACLPPGLLTEHRL
jgi:uncharacterized protein YhaN